MIFYMYWFAIRVGRRIGTGSSAAATYLPKLWWSRATSASHSPTASYLVSTLAASGEASNFPGAVAQTQTGSDFVAAKTAVAASGGEREGVKILNMSYCSKLQVN